MEISKTVHSNNAGIDYEVILTSAVHDMKNSLCLLQQSIETMAADPETAAAPPSHNAKLADLYYEVSRLNSGLIQVLAIYRDKKGQLPLTLSECFIADCFEELLVKNQIYCQAHDIDIEIDIAPDLAWYCDHNLISYLLADVFINALRYSKGKIKVSAYIADNQLIVKIADNGDGYPKEMLSAKHGTMADLSAKQGRTGLGLYFSHLIAHAHEVADKRGEISLTNGGKLGGGIFTLTLP